VGSIVCVCLPIHELPDFSGTSTRTLERPRTCKNRRFTKAAGPQNAAERSIIAGVFVCPPAISAELEACVLAGRGHVVGMRVFVNIEDLNQFPVLAAAVASQIVVNEGMIRALGYRGHIELYSVAFAAGGQKIMFQQAVSANARASGDSLPAHADMRNATICPGTIMLRSAAFCGPAALVKRLFFHVRGRSNVRVEVPLKSGSSWMGKHTHTMEPTANVHGYDLSAVRTESPGSTRRCRSFANMPSAARAILSLLPLYAKSA